MDTCSEGGEQVEVMEVKSRGGHFALRVTRSSSRLQINQGKDLLGRWNSICKGQEAGQTLTQIRPAGLKQREKGTKGKRWHWKDQQRSTPAGLVVPSAVERPGRFEADKSHQMSWEIHLDPKSHGPVS